MEPLHFTEEQKVAYRQVFAPEATDNQWLYFLTECERRALIPGVHVIFQIRYSNEFDRNLQREVSVGKVVLITTINALRLIAQRSGKYQGHTPFEYHYMVEGGTLTTSKIPLGQIPHAVSASFYREGWREALFVTARFDAYKQTKSSGGLTRMWATRSEEQLAKCNEAAGLRTVAPEECGGLYLVEEFGDDQADVVKETIASNPVAIPTPSVAPAVNQATTPDLSATVAGNTPGVALAGATLVSPATPMSTDVKPSTPIQTTVTPPVTSVSGDVKPSKPVQAPPLPKPHTPKSAPQAPQTAPAPVSALQATPIPIAPVTAVSAPSLSPVQQAQAAVAAEVQHEAEQLTPTEVADLKRAMDSDRLPTKPALPPVGAPPVAPAPAAPASGDAPATVAQYNDIIRNRATKLVRDKLDKVAGAFKPTEAGRVLLAYMLKQSGQTELRKASAAKLEEIVSALEAATPETAVKLVKGA